MKIRTRLFAVLMLALAGISAAVADARERIIILNEGNWQADNGKLSYFEEGKIVSNQWFRDVNGFKLGDTPTDIVQINDRLLAIAVNWSNVIQFITPEGKAVATTEDIPNNRHLATDGSYLYVTSYGHECLTVDGKKEFTKGFVAKIDISSFKVVAATEVGYEPEGIAIFDGRLFVANTGGYAEQEKDHEYESTVSVIDAQSMKVVRTVNTGQPNLYGRVSQSGRYLCINSPGDYYEVPAAIVMLDCRRVLEGNPDSECVVTLPEMSATYSSTDLIGRIYAIGSTYSYLTGKYEYNYSVIDPATFFDSQGCDGIASDMPGSLLADLKKLGSPYCFYINPYSGYFYATDAASFGSGGTLHQWDHEGKHLGSCKVYINPGTMIALGDESQSEITTPAAFGNTGYGAVFDLQGKRVRNPRPGEIYIIDGKKMIFNNNNSINR